MATTEATPTTPTTTPTEEPTIVDRMQALSDEMDTAQKQMKNMQTEFKKLQRDLTKALKKKGGKQLPQLDANGEKKVTGFALPVPLSKQLCEFLNLPEESHLSRTDVTRLINQYIKDHNLQDPNNGRQINPDSKLNDLLNPENNDLSYFTLQKYMKHHYKKPGDVDIADETNPTGDVHVDIVASTPGNTTSMPTPKGKAPVAATKKAPPARSRSGGAKKTVVA